MAYLRDGLSFIAGKWFSREKKTGRSVVKGSAGWERSLLLAAWPYFGRGALSGWPSPSLSRLALMPSSLAGAIRSLGEWFITDASTASTSDTHTARTIRLRVSSERRAGGFSRSGGSGGGA